ncbi:MAG: hypothetical protein Q8L39_15290 [Burkholderiales bacterium]|nr:hypothetical protein [Burkholderiales bacterium]
MRIYWDVLDGNAWRCLSATDQRAYIALHRHLRSTNNGDLSLPLSVARTHGITSPATLAKSLRALVAVGLIAVTRTGGCTRGGQRLPTLYRFTDRDCYEVPAKHIEATRPTDEWREVKTLGQGRDLIHRAEVNAAEKAASRKKSLLQSLIVTASNNEAVGPLTASNNEAWTPAPLQIMKQAEKPKTGRKANNGEGLVNCDEVIDSANHTSNNELLSTYYQVCSGSVVAGAAVVACSAAADLPNPEPIDVKPLKRIGKSGKQQKSPATASKASHLTQHINASAYASLRADCLGVGLTWATRP